MYLLLFGILLGVVYVFIESKSGDQIDYSLPGGAEDSHRDSVSSSGNDREASIRQLIADGYHSKAVKVYADEYGVPFDTAMQAIDRLQKELADSQSQTSVGNQEHHDATSDRDTTEATDTIDDDLREHMHELDGFVEAINVLPDHLGQQIKEEILASLHQGKKVQSIQLYQESTGASLKDGKVVIDEFMGTSAFKRFERGEIRSSSNAVFESFSDSEVTSLLQKGKTIKAIKRIRELRGCGLKEAKEIADAIKKYGVYEVKNRDQQLQEARSDRQVQKLIKEQRFVEAIKHFRSLTGLGLKDAKAEIDALRSGGSKESTDSDLEQLLRDGQTIQAIKEYRDRTGCSLREAKDFVDTMRAQL